MIRPTIKRIPFEADEPWVLAHESSSRVWRYDSHAQAVVAVTPFLVWLDAEHLAYLPDGDDYVGTDGIRRCGTHHIELDPRYGCRYCPSGGIS